MGYGVEESFCLFLFEFLIYDSVRYNEIVVLNYLVEGWFVI